MDDPDTWPAELDALIAAPDHHGLLFENEAVRVLNTRIEPGETTKLHTHRWPAAYYVLSFDHFIRRDENGEITLDTKAQNVQRWPGEATWSGPLPPHTLENVGERTIHIISVEVKSSPSSFFRK